MMPRFIVFLTLFVVLSTAFAGVFGLLGCYQCNSYSDRDHYACVDPMSINVSVTTCPNNYVCTRVSYITQKQPVVSRGCDPSGNTCNNIYNTLKNSYPDIADFNCYFCTTNYCNCASGLRVQGPYKAWKPIEEVESIPPKYA